MNSLAMNRLSIIDHAASGGECDTSNPLTGHLFDHEHVIQPGTENTWVSTILYCKRCGHVREIIVDEEG